MLLSNIFPPSSQINRKQKNTISGITHLYFATTKRKVLKKQINKTSIRRNPKPETRALSDQQKKKNNKQMLPHQPYNYFIWNLEQKDKEERRFTGFVKKPQRIPLIFCFPLGGHQGKCENDTSRETEERIVVAGRVALAVGGVCRER